MSLGVRVLVGDAVERLRELPAGCVQVCMTSPPFYGLRDYGVVGQIGLEDSLELWVARLVGVFREVRRVLRDDGVLWVEVGDSYVDKQLVGAPWLLAFALRADGWCLRSEIIWARPNPMPESVTDRPTKAHSTVFLLSKRARYFFDADAIREPASPNTHSRGSGSTPKGEAKTDGNHADGFYSSTAGHVSERNARSVWWIPTQPLRDEHYAAFPEELARRCILAGSSEYGCCAGCGAPWVRVTERVVANPGNRSNNGRIERSDTQRAFDVRREVSVSTVGWERSCGCVDEGVKPCVVLDPFLGSGTTALVARKLGRECVGVELSPVYAEMALRRLRDPDALNRAALASGGPAQLALVEGDGTGG